KFCDCLQRDDSNFAHLFQTPGTNSASTACVPRSSGYHASMSEEYRKVYPDADALAMGAAVELLRLAKESVQTRGLFTLALAGGSTPRKLYSLLGSEPEFREFPWNDTH